MEVIMTFFQSIDWMQMMRCFIVGGGICIIGQILIDKTKLTPARILVVFVTTGVILGALGIYLLKFDFEKVIFNDINPEMIEALRYNLEINDIDDGFEIYNEAFEDLDVDKADLCVIDAYPGVDISEITQKAEKINN